MESVPLISWFDKSTVKHLRFAFSFYLMPVFLFAFSQSTEIHWKETCIAFLVMHLLIFPSSNGYNSYQDKDESSIGGLKYPPKVSKNLYYATILFDVAAILIGMLFVSFYFSLFLFIFIMMSRAYSYRRIRLKKYPVIGFLTVFIFQGGFVFMMASSAIMPFHPSQFFNFNNVQCMIISSLFLGSAYPLTQIYQHEADKKDGVISISYKLGTIGTFIFSGILFMLATMLLAFYLERRHQTTSLILFLLFMLPVVFRLSSWFNKVLQNKNCADFENAMSMNIISSACMNIYFSLLILNHFLTLF